MNITANVEEPSVVKPKIIYEIKFKMFCFIQNSNYIVTKIYYTYSYNYNHMTVVLAMI